MGMSVASSSVSGGRRRRSRRLAPQSEINVTPFVDVMLVLLIVFMVAAPLLTVGVPVELPRTEASQIQSDAKPITVSVQADGSVFIGEEPYALDQVVAKLKAMTQAAGTKPIYVRGDKATDYGTVLDVMGTLSSAGFTKIGLVGVPKG